ncbi:nitrilase [Gracilaria domingensis]|nr:nitrilase [Gracilaria domingensis]
MLVTNDKAANLEKAKNFLRQAKEANTKIAVLPECFQCPYDTACFREYSEPLPDPPFPVTSKHESPSLKMLQDLAQETGMYIVGGSVPEISEDKVFNTSMTVSPTGELIAKHRKAHLFDIDVPGGIKFKESDALTAGEKATAFQVPELSLTVGVAICYDMRFPELAMVQARHMKASLLIYPGAFNMTTGPAHWELLIRSRALDNQVFVAACSPARAASGDGYKAWGNSMVVDPWGKIVAATEEKEALVIAEIDLVRVEKVRKAIPTIEAALAQVSTEANGLKPISVGSSTSKGNIGMYLRSWSGGKTLVTGVVEIAVSHERSTYPAICLFVSNGNIFHAWFPIAGDRRVKLKID